MSDYDSDFYGRANQQAALLRAGRRATGCRAPTSSAPNEIATGHDAMVTAPRETAATLMEIAP